jgi:hypothetical protein
VGVAVAVSMVMTVGVAEGGERLVNVVVVGVEGVFGVAGALVTLMEQDVVRGVRVALQSCDNIRVTFSLKNTNRTSDFKSR